MRTNLTLLILCPYFLSLHFLPLGGQIPPIVPAPVPASDMTPDPSWKPKPGDQITVFPTDAPAVTHQANFSALMKSVDANDQIGLKDLRDRKITSMLEAGTPLLVLSTSGLPVYRGPSTSSALDYRQEIQDSLFRSATQPKRHVSVEVRVLDGPHKGEVKIVAMDSLARLIVKVPEPSAIVTGEKYVIAESGADVAANWTAFQHQPRQATGLSKTDLLFSLEKGVKVVALESESNPFKCFKIRVLPSQKHGGRSGYVIQSALVRIDITQKQGIDKKVIDPSSRAVVLLQLGKNLEKSNMKAAVETYQKIIKDFPDTPSAKYAEERINVISK